VTVPVRLGAVSYLNVRPLVHGLDAQPDRVSLRFDVPSECARLLAAGTIDLGMVPSITYLDRPDDRVVPGVCIGSDGPVASVALFTRVPVPSIRRVALDTSSRTSVALLKVLCRRLFGIAPLFTPHAPDLGAMLVTADAALVIGDAALFADHAGLGAAKVDLGAAWRELTGLPFVWAFWSGRPDAVDGDTVALLQAAARSGTAHTNAIARAYCAGDPVRERIAARYLRENLMFDLTPRAIEGLSTFYREAEETGLVPASRDAAFFGAS
jgi:chorismate dehydratase